MINPPTRLGSSSLAHTLVVFLAVVSLGVGQATVEWTQPTGGVSIAADFANNVFTVNYAYALGAEMTLTKRDVTGNLIWSASYDQTDATKWERASWVTTDSSGNAIVCGTLMSGYSNPVHAASIVMKWNPSGALLWRHVYEASFDGSYTVKCLVDPSDNVYVLGMGAGPGGYVTKVKKFTPGGVAAWSYFDADGIGAPVNFKFTPEGHLLLVGRSIFGSINGYAKIDTTGSKIWALAGVNSLTVGDAAGDAMGNTYAVQGEYVVTNAGTVIRKLGPTGSLLWQQTYALSGFRVEVGTDNHPVVCGFPSSGTPGAAFIKVDDFGAIVWSNLDADGPLGLLLHAQLLLDASNDAYLAAGTLFAMAVCKVRSNGTSAWTLTTAGSYANGIALGRHDDGIFVVGGNTARLVDPDDGPWHDLGHGLAGAGGIPHMFGQGTLTVGNPLSITVTGASPAASTVLVVGVSAVNVPMLGGLLVPSPDLLISGLVADATGTFVLATTWPAGITPGTVFYLQAGVADAGAPMGFAATNAVKATPP